MSIKKIICETQNTRLYELHADKVESIYLEIEDIGECCFEIWSSEDQLSSRALIKLSKKDFEKIIDAYRSRES